MYYNPMQSRIDSLVQQKQMIDNQLQSLQQYANIPPININNQITPNSPNTFDFNGKWVNSEQEARQFANSNLPTILFDNNNPIFYMKNMDGTFKKFRFEEIIENQPINDVDNRINNLENKMNELINALTVKEEKKGSRKNESVKSNDGAKQQ